jgi:hypothetical protein
LRCRTALLGSTLHHDLRILQHLKVDHVTAECQKVIVGDDTHVDSKCGVENDLPIIDSPVGAFHMIFDPVGHDIPIRPFLKGTTDRALIAVIATVAICRSVLAGGIRADPIGPLFGGNGTPFVRHHAIRRHSYVPKIGAPGSRATIGTKGAVSRDRLAARAKDRRGANVAVVLDTENEHSAPS